MASINPGKTELAQYFDVIPSGLNIPSWGFNPGETKLKEGYSYVPSQGNYTPVYSFNKTTKINDPRNNQKAEYDTYHVYKMDTPAAAAPAPTPEPEPTPEPVKEEPKGPVEYSPEIQKAKEKVQQYESNIESGNTSEQIYDPNRKYAQETNLDFSNNLDFSAKTFGGQSSKAAASFLDNKKQSVKNSFSI